MAVRYAAWAAHRRTVLAAARLVATATMLALKKLWQTSEICGLPVGRWRGPSNTSHSPVPIFRRVYFASTGGQTGKGG